MQNPIVTMQAFYNVSKFSFKDITSEKLEDIIIRSKKIHTLYLKEDFKSCKAERYLRIMELINSNYRTGTPVKTHYSSTSIAEKYLLFMFSIDPDFEIAIIFGSEDRLYDIKAKIREKFGIYDQSLIKIEKAVLNKIIDEKKKKEVFDEIDRRAFK